LDPTLLGGDESIKDADYEKPRKSHNPKKAFQEKEADSPRLGTLFRRVSTTESIGRRRERESVKRGEAISRHRQRRGTSEEHKK